MGLDIQINKKMHVTYEGITKLSFYDDVNPVGIYRDGWKQLEAAVLEQIEKDGLKPLMATAKHHQADGIHSVVVVIIFSIEATNG